MRVLKYILALWVSVVVYAGMSMLAGARGVSAYDELLEERKKQEINMETLRRINTELENKKNALLYDHDTIRVYARDLGFGEKNEKFVRIVGLGQARKALLLPGEIVSAETPHSIDNKTIGLISIFAALAVFIALLIQDVLETNLEAPRRD
ncbi:MAG: septum formation initiator family protein [Treponema sp.]|nr:septum formation initiator family protein [Treponema sp.]